MKKDLLDATNQGEYLVLEQPKKSANIVSSFFNIENIALMIGVVLLILIGIAWIVVVLKK